MKRKISQSTVSHKKRKTAKGDEQVNNVTAFVRFFDGLKIHIHPANFGVGRLKIFEKQVAKYGGQLIQDLSHCSGDISHIIFEETVDSHKLKRLLDPAKFPTAVYVKCTWLSICIKNKSREPTLNHTIAIETKNKEPEVKDNRVLSLGTLLYVNKVKESNAGFNVGNFDTNESAINESCQLSSVQNAVAYIQTPAKLKLDKDLDASTSTSVTHHEEVLDESGYLGKHKEESEHNDSQIPEKSEKLKSFPKNLQTKFVCSQPSSSQTKGFNSHITDELEKLAAAYKSKNDTWRAVGYQKAISAIRNYPKEITSREEALAIRGVGARLADKVVEIVESGKLRKVAEVCENDEAKALQLFMGVWGAGPTTAKNWYIQGFRTLDDLRTKATLTRHQQIGLMHYDDINSRIPRNEVVEIENFVKEGALSIKEGLIVSVCGSYRRGKATCGDVDILITHPDGHSHEKLFKPILRKFRDIGFLTDDLVTQEDNGNQQKYLGVCKLPGEDRKHRRLDVIVVPYAEYAPALMYFTGSAHFNRSMRLLATKMGMSLSEHGLRAGVVRQGREKLTEGYLLETPTEESIFTHLGLEYRTPQERDH